MAGAQHRESIDADNAHLPTVSVFIVLLAMMAALTTYVRPSTENFEAAKLSILENFAADKAGAEALYQRLPVSIAFAVNDLCKAYEASCRNIDSPSRDGVAIVFPARRFDPTVAGLSSSENKFLKDISSILAGTKTRLTLLLPQRRGIDGADARILLDLLRRFSAGTLPTAVVTAPALQTTPQFGFLVEPAGQSL